MKILIAEDSPTQATLMKLALQRKGHEVIVARDGIEAMRLVWREAPGLVVSDVEMPRLKGYQVCRLLRDDPQTVGVPVILLTSLDQRQDAFWGLKSGADRFLTKGGDTAQLAEQIHAFALERAAAGDRSSPPAPGGSGRDEDVMERVVHLLDRNLFESTISAEIQSLADTLEDLRATVDGVLGIVRRVVDFHVAAVDLGGEERQGFFALVARPVAPAFIEELRWQMAREAPVPGGPPQEAEVIDPEGLLGQGEGLPAAPGSLLVARLTTKGSVSGAIAVAAAEERAWPERTARTFEMVARRANIVLDYARLYERTKQLSITDGLTKLYNHRYFQDALRREWVRSERQRTPLALALLDIDHFKRFNDTWGHQQGDKVLQELARALREHVRSLDVVARYGGEEFAVLMPDARREVAAAVAERLRAAVGARAVPGPSGPLAVTISLGIAAVPDPQIGSPAALIAAADRALYRAKERGRNRVEGGE